MAKQLTQELLEDYYSTLPQEGEYYARCEMHIPDDIEGKRVLDLECRKGKGAYAISDRVKPGGSVVGIDSSKDNVANAIEWAPKSHWAGADWEQTLSFKQGFPENLQVAGIEDNSVDVVIINSVINVAYDKQATLGEIIRVLKPGGYLYLSNIFLISELPDYMAESIRRDGGPFGSAFTFEEFTELTKQAGFGNPDVESVQYLRVEDLGNVDFADAVVKFPK